MALSPALRALFAPLDVLVGLSEESQPTMPRDGADELPEMSSEGAGKVWAAEEAVGTHRAAGSCLNSRAEEAEGTAVAHTGVVERSGRERLEEGPEETGASGGERTSRKSSEHSLSCERASAVKGATRVPWR